VEDDILIVRECSNYIVYVCQRLC